MKCATESCFNEAAKDRTVCLTCRDKVWRLRHPVEYVYKNLKHNAKRRGKVFTITLEDFREFISDTDYMTRRGRKRRDLTIDRVINELGYEKGNLKIITKSRNSRKQCKSEPPF